jgi:tetratricopeptide (TPR) repeat protein
LDTSLHSFTLAADNFTYLFTMKKQHEKIMTDLQRLVETQEFKSEDELRRFINSINDQKIPSFPEEALTHSEQAQDLVYAAYDLTRTKAKAIIEKALKLDPDCIEAYEFLGSLENTAELAILFYEKSISIGRRIFGGKYMKDHKGMFWGFHETRPFMRCLQHYSDCLYAMGKVKECIAVLEEMIELNPSDNQGVRDPLLLYLIQIDDAQKFLKYAKMYKEDSLAFPLFNRALFAYKTEGETKSSNSKLMKALKQNKFVAQRLLSNKSITNLPDHYGFGDENEADYYAGIAQHVWASTKGAREWLKKHSAKS